MEIASLLDIQPFSLLKEDKEKLLEPFLNYLSRHHYNCCAPYRKMMDGIGYHPENRYSCVDLKFIPVQLFKMIELYSVPKEEIVTILTSSGTSGQKRSMIFLDKESAANQTRVLTKILSSFIGSNRAPMIIIDSESVLRNRNSLSASAAGILGFSLFASTRLFALNEEMELDIGRLMNFLEQHKGKRVFIFGFTFQIYQHLYKVLEESGIHPDLSDAVLIHGGGWKKLEMESVSSKDFNKKLKDIGIRRIHSYYGMVEQTGSVFMECENGHYHTSIFSDIIIRRSYDFSLANVGEEGIIQVLSILPKSYPGHSLLTDDNGILLGEDDCPCGRLGKYFTVSSRIENAEIRGCSDAYEEHVN